MRTLLVILLVPVFALVFLFAITINQIVSTVSSEDLVVRILDDVEIYDYIYDDLMVRLSEDLSAREYEIKFYREDSEFIHVLKLDNPDGDPRGFKVFVDDVLPREYIRRELGENLGVGLAYLYGAQDSFTVDLAAQERIREIPIATERLLKSTLLSGELVEDLIFPTMLLLNSDVLEPALGLGFDESELQQIAFALFAPEWIDHHAVSVTHTMAPYLADDADEFQFVMRVEDRVVIAGEIMKSKLNDDKILYRLVFEQMVRPLLGQVLGLAHEVGFGITLTNQEVLDVMEAIAPREWVEELGNGLIDELTAYLVSSQDEITLSISLKERKDAASFVLTELVMNELRESINERPTCESEIEIKRASEDVSRRSLPSCIPGGDSSVDPILDSLHPLLRMEVDNFIGQQIPDDLYYSHVFFKSVIGGDMAVVDNVRQNVADGVEFSDQDLLDSLAGAGFYRREQLIDPDAQMTAEGLIDLIADGVVWTDRDFVEGLDESSRVQLEDLRHNLATVLSFRWLIWLLIVLPLFLLAYFAADRWSSRLKWGGAILAVTAVLVYAGISILWSNYSADIYEQYLPKTTDFGLQMEENYPSLAEEFKENGPVDKLFEILQVWQERLRNQTVPWIFIGVLAFALGTGWPNRSGSSREQRTSSEKWPIASNDMTGT